MVLAIGGKATEYASSLIDVAQRTLLSATSKQRFATEGVSAAGQPSRLGDRIRRLMGNPKTQQVRLKHTWVVVSLVTLALIVPIIIATGASNKTINTSRDGTYAIDKWKYDHTIKHKGQ